MSKHTKGPWKVCDCGDCDMSQVVTLAGRIECENTKQARLVANAPQLLVALERLYSTGACSTALGDPDCPELIDALQIAASIINQVKGE